MKLIVQYESIDELMALTGINSRDKLTDAGFNLDDIEIGYCTKTPVEVDTWLECRMAEFGNGYKLVEFGDKYFYTIYSKGEK